MSNDESTPGPASFQSWNVAPEPAPGVRDFTQRLERWQNRWVFAEQTVTCFFCKAYQAPAEAGQPFKHFSTCGLSSEAERYPWSELRDLLRELPT